MKSTYNKSEIMKEAHRLFKSNNRFGWSWSKSLKVAWNNAKQRVINTEVEAKNEVIRAIWAAQAEAKKIIYSIYPDAKESEMNVAFFDAMFELKSECNDVVLTIGEAIGALVSYDVCEQFSSNINYKQG